MKSAQNTNVLLLAKMPTFCFFGNVLSDWQANTSEQLPLHFRHIF